MLPNLSPLPISVDGANRLPDALLELIATDVRRRSLPLATVTLRMSSDMDVAQFHGLADDLEVPRQSVEAELSIPIISIDPSSPKTPTEGKIVFPGPQQNSAYTASLRPTVMQAIDQLRSDGKVLNRATDKRFAKTRNKVMVRFHTVYTEAGDEGIWHLKFVIKNESVEQMKLASFKSERELKLRKKEEELVARVLLRYLWHPYVHPVVFSTLYGKRAASLTSWPLFKALAGEEEGQGKSLWSYHFKGITPKQAGDRVERKAQFQLYLSEAVAGRKFFQDLELQRVPTRREVADLVDVLNE